MSARSSFVTPCIPTRAYRVPSGPSWVHEIKHDGYRLQVQRVGDKVRLFTRRGYDWSDRYPAIALTATKLRAQSFTLDGEACVFGPDGIAVFDAGALVDKGKAPGWSHGGFRPRAQLHWDISADCGSIQWDQRGLRSRCLNEQPRSPRQAVWNSVTVQLHVSQCSGRGAFMMRPLRDAGARGDALGAAWQGRTNRHRAPIARRWMTHEETVRRGWATIALGDDASARNTARPHDPHIHPFR
jgi:ATP dependent DNA ligase domain